MVAINNPQAPKPAVIDWSADSASEISSVETQPVRDRHPRRRRRERKVFDRDLFGGRNRRGCWGVFNDTLLGQLSEVGELDIEPEDYAPGYNKRDSALTVLMNNDSLKEEWYVNSMSECYDDVTQFDFVSSDEHKNCNNNDDGRKENPAAVSPDDAFRRISLRLRRGVLRRRELPTDEMNGFEEELRQHFSQYPHEWPRILPPMSRLMAHSVAEYLGLQSRSQELASELWMKKVLVSNRQSTFSPPNVLLSRYLAQRQC